MAPIKFVKVTKAASIRSIERLACQIWREHYIPIIGEAQTGYMLFRFQSEQAIKEQLREGFLYYLIRDKDGRTVGYLGFVPKADELFLSKIYIVKNAREKGCGRQAVKFVEKFARKNKLSRIALTVNKNNVRSIEAYQSMGFSITGAVVQDIGGGFVMDDYRMEKTVF